MRKIPLKFSDIDFGTDEFGYIETMPGEDPDDADMRYTKYLRDKGVMARVDQMGNVVVESVQNRHRLLRETIRALLREAEGVVTTGSPVPGDADPKKQAHVFDFDDTLGLTKNSNGVMLYKDGKPAHKSKEEAEKWLKSMGVTSKNYLVGPGGEAFETPAGLDGVAAYIDSAGLAKLQKQIPRSQSSVSPNAPVDKEGESLYIDFTPSAYVDVDTTDPIKSTIQKLKSANSQGSETMVITARASDKKKPGVNFAGQKVEPSNAEDMQKFLSSQGAAPSQGVLGVQGANKGNEIINKFFSSRSPDEQPEEVHFYDDLSKNTEEVDAAVSGKVPAETFIYGPGEFAHDEASPDNPNKSSPANPELVAKKDEEGNVKKEGLDPYLARILQLAGIR